MSKIVPKTMQSQSSNIKTSQNRNENTDRDVIASLEANGETSSEEFIHW